MTPLNGNNLINNVDATTIAISCQDNNSYSSFYFYSHTEGYKTIGAEVSTSIINNID